MLALLVGAVVAACSSPADQQETPAPSATPAGPDGAAVVQERCTQCHDLARIQSAKKTQVEWQQTVERMIGKGATLSEAEKVAVLDYLAKTYSP